MRKFMVFTLVLFMAGLVFMAETAEKITVYLSGPEEMINALEKEFEAERGDVLDIFLTGCGPLRQKVWAEMEAGKIHADVIWGSDPLIFFVLQENGMLEKYVSPNEKFIKPEYVYEDSDFVIANSRYGVIMYNEELIAESDAPVSFDELTDSKWKDLVGIADINFSSTALAIVSSIWEIYGGNWEFFERMKDNGIMMTRKNSEVPSRIEEGELLLGIAPHDSVLRLQNKAKKEGYKSILAIAWPEEGAISLERPLAIVKNEKRSEGKEKLTHDFVDFMLSRKAQQITVKFGFISVRGDLNAPAGMPADFTVFKVNWKKLADKQLELRDEFKELMLR